MSGETAGVCGLYGNNRERSMRAHWHNHTEIGDVREVKLLSCVANCNHSYVDLNPFGKKAILHDDSVCPLRENSSRCQVVRMTFHDDLFAAPPFHKPRT